MVVWCGDNFKQNWLPVILNILMLVAIGIHGAVYSKKLPSTVVYHYDAYGNPDRSANTRTFIAMYWFSALVSSVVMFILSFVFSSTCCATMCSAPEEASYSPEARRYLRLVVSAWALWLNLAVLGLIFTIFAVLLQNALKAFDRATTFGVYLPFLVFCAFLVLLIFWMLSNVQSAKRLIYSGFFPEEKHDPSLQEHTEHVEMELSERQ